MSFTDNGFRKTILMKSPDDIKREIDRLQQVDDQNSSFEIRAILGNKYPILDSGEKIMPIFHSVVFLYAIEALKNMNDGARNIAELINFERRAIMFHRQEEGIFSDGHSISQETHHTEALKHLLDIGGEEAARAIYEVAQEYPEESVEYLCKLDDEAGLKYVPSAFGLDAEVLALNKVVDLQKQLEGGVLNNISKSSIQEATRDLAGRLLDLGLIKKLVERHRTGDKAKYDGREVKNSLSDVRSAFERVDASNILENNCTPFFDKLTEHFNRYFDEHQALSVELNILLSPKP